MTTTPQQNQDIQNVVKTELSKQSYQSGAPITSQHNHDGNNSQKVSAVNLINSPVYIYAAEYTQDTKTMISMGQNTSKITVLGSVNSSPGGSFAATFTGIASIGNLLTNQSMITTTAPTNPTQLSPTPSGTVVIGVEQACSCFSYAPGTGSAFANIDDGHLIFVTDTNSSTLVTGTIDKLFTTAAEISLVVPNGYTLDVVFIIT